MVGRTLKKEEDFRRASGWAQPFTGTPALDSQGPVIKHFLLPVRRPCDDPFLPHISSCLVFLSFWRGVCLLSYRWHAGNGLEISCNHLSPAAALGLLFSNFRSLLSWGTKTWMDYFSFKGKNYFGCFLMRCAPGFMLNYSIFFSTLPIWEFGPWIELQAHHLR